MKFKLHARGDLRVSIVDVPNNGAEAHAAVDAAWEYLKECDAGEVTIRVDDTGRFVGRVTRVIQEGWNE